MTDQIRIVQEGDSCFLIVLGHDVSPLVNARVHALRRALDAMRSFWLVETVPGYCSLGLIVQPLQVSLGEVEELVSAAVRNVTAGPPVQPRTVTIPVCYGGAYGPDMKVVCQRSGLSEQEVVQRHAATSYQCSMLGSRPGGWNILGRTPLTLFDPSREQPPLVQAGDAVHFSPISLDEFEEKRSHECTRYPQIRNVAE